MKITNVKITGLEESAHFSGLPMSVNPEFPITERDFKRAEVLSATEMGSGHDNFLNGVVVHFFIQASNKWWPEMQRYHFIDFVSSQSTMHRLKSFDLEEQYNKYVDPRIIEIMKELQDKALRGSVDDEMRLLYSNPAGFELGAYMVTNYRQLKTIYAQRKNHRLKEWRDFCAWIETLPSSHYITGKK